MRNSSKGRGIRPGIKDSEGKPQLDLIPYDALVSIAKVRQYGNTKYSDPSQWYTTVSSPPMSDKQRRGMEFIAAAMRHLYKYTDAVYYDNRGVLDEESNIHHLDHAVTSVAMAIAILNSEVDNSEG